MFNSDQIYRLGSLVKSDDSDLQNWCSVNLIDEYKIVYAKDYSLAYCKSQSDAAILLLNGFFQMPAEELLVVAHSHSTNNSQYISVAQHGGECGCFYCLNVFDANKIIKWTNGGRTALCPHCNIDSVLSSQTDSINDPLFLKFMHERFFVRTSL